MRTEPLAHLHDRGRVAPGPRDLLSGPPGGSAHGAGWRAPGRPHRAAPACGQPLDDRRTACRRLPPRRTRRVRRRDRPRDAEHRARQLPGDEPVRGAGFHAGDLGADRAACRVGDRGPLAHTLGQGTRARPVRLPAGAGVAVGRLGPGVPGRCRRGVSRRCLPLPVDRGVPRHAGVDRARAIGRVESARRPRRPPAARRTGGTRLLAGVPGGAGVRRSDPRRRGSRHGVPRRPGRVVPPVVPALLGGRLVRRLSPRGIPQSTCLPSGVEACATALGAAAGLHGNAVRPAAARAGTGRARRGGPLDARVHPPVSRWQRPHGTFPDERDAGGGRLPVDDHPGRRPPALPGSLGRRQRRAGFRPLCGVRSGSAREAAAGRAAQRRISGGCQWWSRGGQIRCRSVKSANGPRRARIGPDPNQHLLPLFETPS